MLFLITVDQIGTDERARGRCSSDRSNFSEPLDCVLVVLADGGFHPVDAVQRYLAWKKLVVRGLGWPDAGVLPQVVCLEACVSSSLH